MNELILNAEQVDDVDTMLQYLIGDGKELEDFIDFAVEEDYITDEEHEILLDKPDSKEAAKILDDLSKAKKSAHVWPAARRLEMTIRKFMVSKADS